MSSNKHALVFGASGLAGWGVINTLLSTYPNAGTFAMVTAVVNRPLSLEKSYWPLHNDNSPDFQLVEGADLSKGTTEAFAEWLKANVRSIESVSHVYYYAYKQVDDPKEQVRTGLGMLRRAIGAIELLCPKLSFVVFPGGLLRYGAYYTSNRPFEAPFREDMGRMTTEPGLSDTMYYAFEDWLDERSRGKSWTWCEVVPDAIIGFSPTGSTFNLTAHWAMYLSVYALVEGKGATVPFPGTPSAYDALYNEASSEIIARFSIWASINPDKVGRGQIFNIADSAKPSSMSERWPKLCAYFGLKGVGPSEVTAALLKPGEYVEEHIDVLHKNGVPSGQVWGASFLDTYGYWLTVDRHFSLDKAKAVGFDDEMDPTESWTRSFSMFRKAGLLPVWT